MCPLFKKNDPTDIRNYRPITVLNTDYKILTKVLTLQLIDHTKDLVHEDQAGFIPRRSIFNHIRLAKAIISYAKIVEEDGAIIALDVTFLALYDYLLPFTFPLFPPISRSPDPIIPQSLDYHIT